MVAVTALSSVPSTWTLVRSPPNDSAAALHRSSSATLPASWITQMPLVSPSVLQSGTDRRSGDGLGLADVGDRAELGRLVDPGVDRDDGNAGSDGGLDAVLEPVRVGHRHHDAVDLVGDRGVDQLGLLGRVGVVRVLHRDAVVVAGTLGTRLDAVPEGVAGGSVGDDRVGVVVAVAAATSGVVVVLAGAAAPGQDRDGEQQRASGVQEPELLHGCASFVRWSMTIRVDPAGEWPPGRCLLTSQRTRPRELPPSENSTCTACTWLGTEACVELVLTPCWDPSVVTLTDHCQEFVGTYLPSRPTSPASVRSPG